MASSLSVCMIVRNEATNLPRCLASVAPLQPDIHIVDTGSSDETIAIAQQWQAQVISRPWNNDFAQARNQSLALAQNDWILVIDADEALTPAGRQALKTLLAKQPIGSCPSQNILLITWLRQEIDATQAPYTQVSRLFRRHPALCFQRPYHETIDDSIDALIAQTPHWQIVQLPTIAMQHWGYCPDTIAQQDKLTRARHIIEPYLQQHPNDSYLCNKLGALYGQSQQWQTSLKWLNQALSQGKTDPVTTAEVHYHLGLAYRQLDQPKQALFHYNQAIATPIPPILNLSAYLNRGSLHHRQGNPNQAIQDFLQVINLDPTLAIGHYNLGLAYRQINQLDAAIAAYHQAVIHRPHYPEAYQNLGVALLKQGKGNPSQQAFTVAIQQYSESDPAAAAALRQKLAAMHIIIA